MNDKPIKPVISETSGIMYVAATTTPVAPAKNPSVKDVGISGDKRYVAFGNSNNYPEMMFALGRKDNIIPTAVSKIANAMYGAALNFGTVDYGNDDSIIRTSLYGDRKDIRSWLKNMNEKAYRHQFSMEFSWLNNCFVQGILSFDRKRIERFVVIPTRKCRLSVPDENGISKTVLISADFTKKSPEVELPLIDHLYDPVGQIKSIKGNRFMLHFKKHTPDLDHYAIPDWDSARQSKLLSLKAKTIAFKESYNENRMKVANILYIADWYLMWKYSDWDEKPELQQSRFEETVNNIEQKLSDPNKAGVTLSALTQEIFNKDKQETRDPFRLVPIDRPKLDELLNEDISEANVNIFIAAGIDATLVMSTGNNMGGGSGSNKRVAQNNMGNDAQAYQDMMLTPLNIGLAYNFEGDIECWLMQTYIATLDTGKETIVKPQ